MTKDPQNPAQEVQEYTPEQAAQLIKAAAEITGKPVTAFSVADAEAVLFGEIGYTRPPRPAEAARKELMQYVAERLKQQQESPENLTKPDIETIEQRLAAVKMRMVAVRALYDDGQGIEQELAEITAQLDSLKRQQSGEKAVLEAIEKYLDYAGTVADELTDRRTHRKLDLPEVTEAQNAIKENPAILGFVPPEAFINHELRELAQSEDEETAVKAVNAILNSTGGVLEKLAKMAQDVGRALEAFKERTEQAIEAITVFVNSPKYERLQAAFTDFAQWFDPEHPDTDTKLDLFWLQEFFNNFDELMPYIEEELERLHRERGVTEIPLGEFLQDTDPETGEPIKSLFQICVDRANEARAAKANAPGFDLQMFSAEDEAIAEIEQLATYNPVLQSLLPTRHTMPNNALMNALQQKQAINAGAFDLVVANPHGRRKEITAYTMVTYDAEAAGTALAAANLSEYERQVSDAVITLWLEAKKQELPPVFTTDMIFRAMPGGGDKPSPQQRGAITKAIEKMRNLHITVDATEEMRLRGAIGKNEVCEFDDFYLSALRVQRRIKNGGQTVTAYKLNTEPVILTYSRMTKQILEVNAKYIEIRKVKKGQPAEIMPMTAGRQAMAGYMLRRITVMKRDKKNKVQTQSNVILFDTLFAEAGTATDNREITRRNRDFCFDVLDYWKATGLIKGYAQQTKGRSITGIVIEL